MPELRLVVRLAAAMGPNGYRIARALIAARWSYARAAILLSGKTTDALRQQMQRVRGKFAELLKPCGFKLPLRKRVKVGFGADGENGVYETRGVMEGEE